MLADQQKTSPITTDESWYTPHKHKNVSAIETNPSMNVANFHSNQYSSIELSQSLAQSPSFLSPNKQLGSFLMTPNYSSKYMLPLGTESIGDMRLRTESIVETSRFYDLTDESKKSLPQTTSTEANELLKLINEIRSVKAKKTFHSRKVNENLATQQFLLKQITQKEQNILAHKQTVQQKIKQKAKLNNRLKQKKARIKAKAKSFINQLSAKVNKLKEELETTCSLLNLEHMQIDRFHNELYHVNTCMQHQGYMIDGPYSAYQNQRGINMMQSRTEQMNYQKIPGFYSNPSSSRSENKMKKSNQEILKSGQQKSANSSNLSVEDLLKNHFSSMMGKGQTQQKLRKFSFGQNPSFCMQRFEEKPALRKENSLQNAQKVPNNNPNPIMQALAMRVNQIASQNASNNPQSLSPQKRSEQHSSPFITQHFDKISPIAAGKKVTFSNQLETPLDERQRFAKHQLSTDKKEFGQIIEQLNNKQDSSECAVQYYNESVVDINEDSMIESRHKNSPRLNFNKKHSESPQHKRTQSGQTAKKSIKLPLVLEQSIIQIAYESSTLSDNLQYQDFTPIKHEEVQRRLRSPTHQVMPAIHEQMNDLRKTENRLKFSNKQAGSSKNSGGAQTPIFRSQASEEEQHIGFSRAFLGGSMKESQIMQNQTNEEEAGKPISKSRQNPQRNSQQRAYHTMVLSQSKKSQPYSIYQTQNLKTIQNDEQQDISSVQQSDDDFYSCTLGTESKIFVQSTIKSRQVNDIEIESDQNTQNHIKRSKTRYNQEQTKQHQMNKDMNLVLENVKNKHYDMNLNLSEIGERSHDNYKMALELNRKGTSVELQRQNDDLSGRSFENNSRLASQRANDQARSTL